MASNISLLIIYLHGFKLHDNMEKDCRMTAEN